MSSPTPLPEPVLPAITGTLQKKESSVLQPFETADPHILMMLFAEPFSGLNKDILNGDSAKIWSFYRDAFDKDPTNAQFVLSLASAALLNKWNSLALKLSDRVLQDLPDLVQAHYVRGLALFRLKEHKLGETLITGGVTPPVVANDKTLYYLLLGVYEQDEGFNASSYSLTLKKRDIYRSPDTLSPYYPFQAYQDAAKLQSIVKGTPQAVPLIDVALAIQPAIARAYVAKAINLSSNGNPEEARRNFERAIELTPKYARAHEEFAKFLLAQGQNELSKKHLDIAQQLNPSTNVIQTAKYYISLSAPEQVINLLGNFKSSIPYEQAEANLLLGRAYMLLKNFDQAESLFNSAQKLTPEDLQTIYFLGHVAFYKQAYQTAIDRYTSYIAKHPHELVIYSRGVAYFELKKFEAAKEDFEAALKVKPDFIDAKYNLAGTLGSLGKIEEAIKLYLEIPSSFESMPSLYANLGYAYTQLGKCDEAGTYYAKANQPAIACTAKS